MRIGTDARLPQTDDPALLRQRLYELHRDMSTQLNAISEGLMKASSNAATVAPTSGSYAQGDFVRNSAPVEAGAGGSKYVVFGFICVASGSPGTFVPMRFLTGN